MIFRHLLNMRSHPTWVRELKLNLLLRLLTLSLSHPTWVRELKQNLATGALSSLSRTLRGCVN